MKEKGVRRPQAVMLSKRANVFYLEQVRVMQKDGRVVYLTEANERLEQFVSIPDKNTSFILLGKGSSITDAAVRMLSESNVVVGFCGSGGSPLFAMGDVTFMLPQDEYRPTEYAQKWFSSWIDEAAKLSIAKKFLLKRIDWDRGLMSKYDVEIDHSIYERFADNIARAPSTTDLLSAEAQYAKSLYASMSRTYKLDGFSRDPGKRKNDSPQEKANSFLDHGNYLAYGYAAVSLHGLGIPYFLPVLHGKTRRGALVFDVADLFKDWLVMPAAFEGAARGWSDKRFRASIIERALKNDVLDELMTFIKGITQEVSKKQ